MSDTKPIKDILLNPMIDTSSRNLILNPNINEGTVTTLLGHLENCKFNNTEFENW